MFSITKKIYDLIGKQYFTKKCEYCDELFDTTDDKRIFCNKDIKVKFKKCVNGHHYINLCHKCDGVIKKKRCVHCGVSYLSKCFYDSVCNKCVNIEKYISTCIENNHYLIDKSFPVYDNINVITTYHIFHLHGILAEYCCVNHDIQNAADKSYLSNYFSNTYPYYRHYIGTKVVQLPLLKIIKNKDIVNNHVILNSKISYYYDRIVHKSQDNFAMYIMHKVVDMKIEKNIDVEENISNMEQ